MIRKRNISVRIATHVALLTLCSGLYSCKPWGNVVNEDATSLPELPGATGVAVHKLRFTSLDIKAEDGAISKSYSFGFVAEGEALTKYSPGFKYVCALPEVALTDGFTFQGNSAKQNKQEPDIGFIALNSFLKSTKSPEPAVCELELRLRERGPEKLPPQVNDQQSVGKVCYEKQGTHRKLTAGACEGGRINRKVLETTSAVSPRVLTAQWRKLLSPPNMALFPGIALVVNKLPLPENFAVRTKAICKEQNLEEQTAIGRNHFSGVEPGEAIWQDLPLFGQKSLTTPPGQCELSVQVLEGETVSASALFCVSANAAKEGACS